MDFVLESDSEKQVRSRETTRGEETDEEEPLDNVHVSAPQGPRLSSEADTLCPESYRLNSTNEVQLLAIAENFQRQYSHLYPDRKPLLLCPLNECGVKKFVSTTLRPSLSGYPELFTWEDCASFVADFLSLDPLESPVDLPRCLFSSTKVLQTQRATCVEFATLLCSLLLGNSYDAYCVSGYAVKEMCLLDQSWQQCPLLDTEVKSVRSEQEHQENKYTVKHLLEQKSHFMMQQEKKQQEAEATFLREQKQKESERRPADPLRGLRVHCWVMVLSGSRGIRENFFIDPLTGNSYATDDGNFLGIESAWNNLNYYVNMQDCRNGCIDMVFDLEDSQTWEPLLHGAPSHKQLLQDASKKKENKKMSRIDDQEEEPRVFQMPRSWVSYISISKKDLETRWPGGKKVTHYRGAKLERFAAYLRPDGLVTRLTTYKDPDRTEVDKVKDRYQHRDDLLEEREVSEVDGVTTERFKQGRRFSLLFHRYTSLKTHAEREMEFSRARVDHLVQRVESRGEMTELFEGRRDFLYHRKAVFDRHDQLSDADVETDVENFALQKVVERFHRNKSKPASEDVAERVFLLAERRVEVTYHFEDHCFIPSKRSFIKPRQSTQKKKGEKFTPDMASSFQVDSSAKPLKILALNDILVNLMKDEDEAVLQIRESKREVRNILTCREQEERHVQLNPSPWTTAGLAMARSQRQTMERLAAEEQRWLQEKETDLLAPVLIRLDNPETLSAEDARQLHEDCLAEFKERLEEQANLIQESCQKETQELQKKQHWYQKNQQNMTAQQMEEYQSYCAEKTLRIQVARKHLIMLEETASKRYGDLDKKLRGDPRLSHLLT